MTKFHDKFAGLREVNSPKSQDKFQICFADMCLVRFLVNIAAFWVFLRIARVYMNLRRREISEALNLFIFISADTCELNDGAIVT